MFLIRVLRWYYRDRENSRSAHELCAMGVRDVDEVELHFRTGKWLTDCFTNCMSKEEHIASLLWLSQQNVRISRDAAQTLESVCNMAADRYLVMARIEGREVESVPIERTVMVGTYDRQGFHRRVTEHTAEELLCR